MPKRKPAEGQMVLPLGRSERKKPATVPAIEVPVGYRVGRLVVTGPVETIRDSSGLMRGHYPVRCDCGAERLVNSYSLRNRRSFSCGCLAAEKSSARMKRWRPGKTFHKPVPVGTRFGRLVVTGPPAIRTYGSGCSHGGFSTKVCYPVLCDCGTETVVDLQNLKSGCSTSCGCYRSEVSAERFTKHGGTKSRLFNIWSGMKARCHNPTVLPYKDYGGRGIAVCPEWRDDFAAFRNWAIENGYRDGLTIDRYPDNNGNYEPGNCRWATPAEQNRNRRDNLMLTAFGETKCATAWLEDPRCVASMNMLKYRLHRGWEPEEAITRPASANRKVGRRRGAGATLRDQL